MNQEETDSQGASAPDSASPLMQPEHAAGQPPQKPAEVKTKTKAVPLVAALLLLFAFGAVASLALRQSSQGPADHAAQAEQRYDIPLIRIASEGPYDAFYPNLRADGTGAWEMGLQVYESLVAYEGGEGNIVPLLATSWTNPDSSTWDFKLKEGVKFHTGRTMTAEDVKKSLEASLETERGQIYATTIASIEALDPNTLRIKTLKPDPVLLNRLTTVHVYDTQAADVKGPSNGTGAFTLKPGTVAEPGKVTLVAFDEYHGGRPNVRELQYTAVSEVINLDFVNRGEHDFFYYVANEDIPKLDSAKWANKQYSNLTVSHIGINHVLDSPLKDVRVRRALSHAIDPVKLMEVRGFGNEQASQLLSPIIPGYDPSITPSGRDIAEAKRLLAEAGYPDGLELEFTYFAAAEPTVLEIQRQAAEAGITIKLDKHELVSTIGPKVIGGQAQLWWRSFGSDLYDAVDAFSQIVGSPVYQNEAAAAKLAEAEVEFDPERRVALLQEISRQLMDDVALIPIVIDDSFMVYDAGFKGVVKDVPGAATGISWRKAYSSQPR